MSDLNRAVTRFRRIATFVGSEKPLLNKPERLLTIMPRPMLRRNKLVSWHTRAHPCGRRGRVLPCEVGLNGGWPEAFAGACVEAFAGACVEAFAGACVEVFAGACVEVYLGGLFEVFLGGPFRVVVDDD